MIVSFCAVYFISRIPAVHSSRDKTESKRFTKTAKTSNAFFSVSTFPMIVHYSKWLKWRPSPNGKNCVLSILNRYMCHEFCAYFLMMYTAKLFP